MWLQILNTELKRQETRMTLHKERAAFPWDETAIGLGLGTLACVADEKEKCRTCMHRKVHAASLARYCSVIIVRGRAVQPGVQDPTCSHAWIMAS